MYSYISFNSAHKPSRRRKNPFLATKRVTDMKKSIRMSSVRTIPAAALFVLSALIVPVSSHAVEHLTYFTSTGPVTSMDSHESALWCGTKFGLVRWNTGDMSHTILRVPDGLPHADIVDLDVSSSGILWVATAENGVARFDGTTWKSHALKDGLPYLNGLSIHAADNGNVYAGVFRPDFMNSGGGLSRFNGTTWTSTQYATLYYDTRNFVNDIATDSGGTVWAACGGKLASVVDSTWTFYDVAAARIIFDTRGTLWIHTGQGIKRAAEGSFQDVSLPEGINGADIVALGAPAGGGVMAMTKYGELIGITVDGGVTVLCAKDAESRFTAMTIDGAGAVWAGLSDGGIARFSGSGWTTFPLGEPSPGTAAYRITMDNSGIPWAATDNGLYRYAGRSWERVVSGDKTSGYGNDPDFALFFDSGNRLWLLGYYDGKKNIRYLAGNTLVSDPTLDARGSVFQTVPDTRNGLWLKFENSQNLFRYENGVLTEIPISQGLSESTRLLAADVEGGLWYSKNSMETQLFRYRDGIVKSYPESIMGESGFTLGFGPDGSIWLSQAIHGGSVHWPMYQGRILCKPSGSEKFSAVHDPGSGSSLHCVDSHGRLWISRWGFEDSDYRGTHYYGIRRYDGDASVDIRETSGLPDDHIYDVKSDGGNGIWIATAKGIVRYADDTTGVAGQTVSPSAFDAVSAYPNPFNPSTTICFTLPRTGTASAAVYSITGQKVRTLGSGMMNAGTHRVVWNGRDDKGIPAASGVYFVRITADRFNAAGKITLVR